MKTKTTTIEPFLWWWLCFCSFGFLSGMLWFFDIPSVVWAADQTKLSFVIVTFFLMQTVYLGLCLYFVCMRRDSENWYFRLMDSIDKSWYLADFVFIRLGLLGTLIGFILIFGSAFASLDMNNLDTFKDAMYAVTTGMATAIYTTISGIGSSILLSVQIKIIEHYYYSEDE